MKKIFSTRLFCTIVIVLSVTACKKSDSSSDDTVTTQEILTDFSSNVAVATYADLHQQAIILSAKITTFNTSNTQVDLDACRAQWKIVRSAYEQSEGFLFGPVATNDIDPKIDTWPVDFNSLDSIVNSSSTIDEAYINGLDDALRGFHPIEYLLWGVNGNKIPSDFTVRQKEYLMALSSNLNDLTNDLNNDWVPGAVGSYYDQFVTAGSGSAIYGSKNSAFIELVDAMAGICDEVANEKINTPFVAHNASLEESPFAKNSINDFKSNIQSAKNVYEGGYKVPGKGIKNFVAQNNTSLDNIIEQKFAAAFTALNAITDPFGTAITTQPVQIQQAQLAINDLRSTLENDLINLVNLKIKD